MEEWRAISVYEGLYEVSNTGLVKSLTRKYANFRILKPGTDKGGYRRVSLSKNNKAKTHKVHRLVAMAFIPNPENKPEVNHIDGDKSNNNDWNLEWSTHIENIEHSVDLGLQKPNKGEKNGFSKLTNKQAQKIRIKYSTGKYTQKELAMEYNVHQGTISNVVKYICYPI